MRHPRIDLISEMITHNMQNQPTYTYKGPFKKAVDVADYYGFRLIKPIPKTLVDEEDDDENESEHHVPLKEKKLSIEYYQNEYRGSKDPVLVCHTRHPRRKEGCVKLEVFGCSKGIAEAMVMRAAVGILKEHGYDNLRFEINSLGNKESRENFAKEFVNFYKKNLGQLGECCQTVFRTNSFRVTECSNDPCTDLRSRAPRSIEFLNEDGRRHLMEVIEYVESIDVPYRINEHLIGPTESHSRTLFKIVSDETSGSKKDKNTSRILARGDRYDYVTRKLRYRTIIPAVGVSVSLPGGKHESYKEKKAKQEPVIHYIHLGREAKRLSLPLLETLRSLNLKLHTSLLEDSLAPQIERAEASNTPFTIIMGLKEAQERSVIVRDMATRAQETVPIPELPRYMKRIVKTI